MNTGMASISLVQSTNYGDVSGCCQQSLINIAIAFLRHIDFKIPIEISIGSGTILFTWEKIKIRWRFWTYKNLYYHVRKLINYAIKSAMTDGPEKAHRELSEGVKCALGPLHEVFFRSSTEHSWIKDVVDLIDERALENLLDLELIQASHCEANKCKHLGTPFSHYIYFEGALAENTPHSVRTVQTPGLGDLGSQKIDLTDPKTRKFPIRLGNTHAFVDVGIGEIKGGVRIICDCENSSKLIDLKELTGASPPPPGVPKGPVFRHQMTNRQWAGLQKRKPNAAERAKFCQANIAALHASWKEPTVVNFLADLHDAMHRYRR
jgi:hypothetical protein